MFDGKKTQPVEPRRRGRSGKFRIDLHHITIFHHFIDENRLWK